MFRIDHLSHMARYTGNNSICMRCNSIATNKLYHLPLWLYWPQILDYFPQLILFYACIAALCGD